MPMNNSLTGAQQENLITLLCHSDQYGGLVANLIDPGLFDGDYRDIALASKEYWRRYNCAPKAHTPDLFARKLEANDRRANALRRALQSMVVLSDQINAEYVINDLQQFARRQTLKTAILRAAQALNNENTPLEEAEAVMNEVLRARQQQFTIGTRLDDDLDSFIEYLHTRHTEFSTGIEALDAEGVVPIRKGIFMFLGGKGKGKSWFLTTVGRQAMWLHKRVLHISLEMDEPEVRQRYYQSLWAVPKHQVPKNKVSLVHFRRTTERNPENNRREEVIDGYQLRESSVEFSLQSPDVRAELQTRIMALGDKTEDLVIKRFPNHTLTIDMLEGYLDYLEQVQRFIPDIVIIDYARLMKQNARNAKDYRISIGQNIEALRALAIERNFALVTADQFNRQGIKSPKARSTDVGEDISQIFTSDVVVSLSKTEAEHETGLARIFVDHCRGGKDQFTVLLTQALAIGQFVTESCVMPSNYYDDIAPGRKNEQPLPEGDDDDEDEDTEEVAADGGTLLDDVDYAEVE